MDLTLGPRRAEGLRPLQGDARPRPRRCSPSRQFPLSLTCKLPTATHRRMEAATVRRGWSSRTTDYKLEINSKVGSDQWEVTFSDRPEAKTNRGVTTCEKFVASRGRVNGMIASLCAADRRGERACQEEYQKNWESLRRAGVSERIQFASRATSRIATQER